MPEHTQHTCGSDSLLTVCGHTRCQVCDDSANNGEVFARSNLVVDSDLHPEGTCAFCDGARRVFVSPPPESPAPASPPRRPRRESAAAFSYVFTIRNRTRTHEEDTDDERGDEIDEEVDDGRPAFRHYSRKSIGRPGQGKIVEETNLSYGVEIEAIPRSMGAAVRTTRNLPLYFGVESDGSIVPSGLEFTTPPLFGAEGEKVIEELCDTLQRDEWRVNKTCGLHVHFGNIGENISINLEGAGLGKSWFSWSDCSYRVEEGLSEKKLPFRLLGTRDDTITFERKGKRVSEVKEKEVIALAIEAAIQSSFSPEKKTRESFKAERVVVEKCHKNQSGVLAAYLLFEDVILSFLPETRRGGGYAKTMRAHFALSRILDQKNADFERIWYGEDDVRSIETRKKEKYDNTRYFGVNFHSLFFRGTIEVRHHTGTLNPRKILEWINLNAKIIDTFSGEKGNQKLIKAVEVFKMPTLDEKTALLFSTLNLRKESEEYFLRRQRLFSFKAKKRREEEDFSPAFRSVRVKAA